MFLFFCIVLFSDLPPFFLHVLTRFRLRYNTYDDVYYVHWDKNVCAALSKYEGLTRGLFSASKMERHLDNKDGMVGGAGGVACVCVCLCV